MIARCDKCDGFNRVGNPGKFLSNECVDRYLVRERGDGNPEFECEFELLQ